MRVRDACGRTLTAVVFLLALRAGGLRAQSLPTAGGDAARGRIEGQVVDSLRGRPLAAAIVRLVRLSPEPGTFAGTVAGVDGRFRFDSLVAGRYVLSFSSDLLDSLELVLPDRLVDLTAGARVELFLASPSASTLRAAACPGVHLEAGQGAVVGSVLDAATELPMIGATVVVAWSDLILDRATLRTSRTARTGAVTTDSAGHYRLCGVPTDVSLQLQVQRDSVSSSVVEATVDDSVGMKRQDLSMARGRGLATAADTGRHTVRLPLASGGATLAGQVQGVGNRPLADVDVRVAGARGAARSDSLGRFLLAGLPAGTQMLEARRIGYGMLRVPVQLREGQTVTQRLQLVRIVSLDSIRIVAQRSRYPEYERHRKSGWGTYLEQADILRRNPFRTSDLLRMSPGFRVEHRGFEDVVVSSRSRMGRGACPVNVVIDGMQHAVLEMVHPSDIAAMEIYPSSSLVPVEYASQSPCGAVVIWTRR